jgi:LuxR family quorum-sensing transcriptional regulator LasR
MVEMARLLALIDAPDQARWRAQLIALAREQGFEKVLYGAVNSRHAKLENAFVTSNYSSAWRERYDAERRAYVDPTVIHSLSSNLPIVWGPDTFVDSGQRELYEEACGYGIRAGVTLPVHGPNGEFGLLSFATDSPADARFDRELGAKLGELVLIRDYVFSSSVRFCNASPENEAAPRLTRRELEVLNWVMAGKSSWEISKITNCSEATVNFHMANVRQKFNVNTRQQAVVKAISLGLVTPEDLYRSACR